MVGGRLRLVVLQQAGRWPSDAGLGKMPGSANPDDELDRLLALHSRVDLLAPLVLFERVRHRVVCHSQVGGSQESTLVRGPGLQQRRDAPIGAGNQEEASATLKLPPGELDRGSSKGGVQ